MADQPVYILKYQSTRRGDKPRLWTVAAENLQGEFQRRVRRTGRSVAGLGPEVEFNGVDRSRINLRARSTLAVDELGKPSSIGWLKVKLLQRHQSIRIARQEDLAKLAAMDERIEEKKRELGELRKERRDIAVATFAAGGKVDIDVLEAMADA